MGKVDEGFWVPPGTKLPRDNRLPSTTPIRIADYQLDPHAPPPLMVDDALEAGCWLNNHLAVVASVNLHSWGEAIHASIMRRDRAPSWEEIYSLRDTLFPHGVSVGLNVASPAARESFERNFPGEFSFHLAEVPAGWGIR